MGGAGPEVGAACGADPGTATVSTTCNVGPGVAGAGAMCGIDPRLTGTGMACGMGPGRGTAYGVAHILEWLRQALCGTDPLGQASHMVWVPQQPGKALHVAWVPGPTASLRCSTCSL